MAAAMSLIEFEWKESENLDDGQRRLWMIIQSTGIKINR